MFPNHGIFLSPDSRRPLWSAHSDHISREPPASPPRNPWHFQEKSGFLVRLFRVPTQVVTTSGHSKWSEGICFLGIKRASGGIEFSKSSILHIYVDSDVLFPCESTVLMCEFRFFNLLTSHFLFPWLAIEQSDPWVHEEILCDFSLSDNSDWIRAARPLVVHWDFHYRGGNGWEIQCLFSPIFNPAKTLVVKLLNNVNPAFAERFSPSRQKNRFMDHEIFYSDQIWRIYRRSIRRHNRLTRWLGDTFSDMSPTSKIHDGNE